MGDRSRGPGRERPCPEEIASATRHGHGLALGPGLDASRQCASRDGVFGADLVRCRLGVRVAHGVRPALLPGSELFGSRVDRSSRGLRVRERTREISGEGIAHGVLLEPTSAGPQTN